MKTVIPIREKQYQKLLYFLGKTPRRKKLFSGITRALPAVFFLVYALELLFWGLNVLESRFSFSSCITLTGRIIMPALCLFSSTVLRMVFNRKRPYEVFSITPLIAKDTHGRSFPSNHTASAFVLAIGTYAISQPLFWIMLCLAFLTGCSRIAAGLHWPEDVLAGALLGSFFGILELILF